MSNIFILNDYRKKEIDFSHLSYKEAFKSFTNLSAKICQKNIPREELKKLIKEFRALEKHLESFNNKKLA